MKQMKKLILFLIIFTINFNYVSAEELSCTTTLSKGTKGENVKILQTKLNEIMNCHLKVDGIYGNDTKKCVSKFQTNNDLTKTGTVNKNTCKALNRITDSTSFSINLKKGSTGELVEELQIKLNKVTNCNLEVDGVYGNDTKKCVSNFQTNNNLTKTGIVNETTYNAINEIANDSFCGTTLKKGNTGEMVKTLQTKLNDIMNCNLEIDGIYGNLTKSCVMKYQRSSNLDVTGIFEGTTCNNLKNQNTPIDTEVTLQVKGKSIIVTGDKVNIRKGKSTNTKVLGKAKLGEILEYTKTEKKNGKTWYKVKLDDGYGYIQSTYASKNFIVVDKSQQKLILYKNEKVILNTEVVTGMYENHDTPTGYYKLKVKNLVKGKTLRGYNDDGSKYASYVDYWMPFIVNRGIGFHDASWRGTGEYTDTRYLYDGSHGCINMKPEDAKTLFTNITENIDVIIRD